jgi:uncharacterized protein
MQPSGYTFPMDGSLPRGLYRVATRAWTRSAVVVLEGLRATGKTTLAKQLVNPENFRTFNEQNERDRATDDTAGWVEALPEGTVIDEAQLVPLLQLSLKDVIDRRGAHAGQFLLTGSSRLSTNELGGSDPLAGRVTRLRLHPFAQCELASRPLDVVKALFEEDPRSWTAPACNHLDIIGRASLGGFPLFHQPDAAPLDGRDRSLALDNYVAQLFGGDVYQTGRDSERIARTFRWITARSGSTRNYQMFANEMEMHRNTLSDYLGALFDVHLLEQVPGFRPGLDKRETDKERLFVADPAFVAAMLPTDVNAVMRNTDGFSSLLETFVATEVIRLLTWSSVSAKLFHWRDSNTNEVDLILERRDGSLIGIEVKAARVAKPDHLSGLREFRKRYPSQFLRGFVIHSGDHVSRFEDDLWALPFSALWSIGDRIGQAPAASSIVDRFRKQISTIRIDPLVSAEVTRRRAVNMDEVFEDIAGWIEQFGEELKRVGIEVAIDGTPSVSVSADGPTKSTLASWSRYARLTARGSASRDYVLTVEGKQFGDGSVTWSMNRGGTQTDEGPFAAEVDHRSIVGRMLEAFVDEIPAIVASLRN